ncbi:MAG: hypothetical protein K2N06_03580 [Oscillospiraceae bacterium]|nr:hypothetical protein [Oscillospiraceae bacterium]
MKNNNTKTRITAFFMSLFILAAVGLCSFSTVSYADTTFNFDGIKDAQYDNWDNLPSDFKELGQAYFNYFSGKGGSNILESASKIPMAWFKVLKDGTPVLSPLGQLFYYLDGGELFVEDKSEGGINHGGGGGRHRAGDTNPVVPSESFVNAINNNTTSVIPSVQTFDRSWANNPLSTSSYDSKRTSMFFTFIENGNYFGIKDCRDIYGVPYITYEGIKYYYPYLCHFSYTNKTSTTSSETDDLYSCVDVSLCMKVSDTEPTRYYSNKVTTYAIFYNAGAGNSFFAQGCNAEYYSTGFSVGSSSTYPLGFSGSSFSPFYKGTFFSSSNIVDSIDSYKFFRGELGTDKPTFTGSVSDKSYNYGFELSIKPFYLGALSSFLDGSLIPDNSYITISGDSIYDYSITNSNNGDTTNLGDFINNGYAWLNTGSGTQNNQGIGSGGNVNVSGDINVGGSVDININVNGGGNGQNLNDYIDPGSGVDTSLDNYLQYVPEVSKGFIDYLKDFFAWLPLPIYGLLILGLIVAIFCRLTGR